MRRTVRWPTRPTGTSSNGKNGSVAAPAAVSDRPRLHVRRSCAANAPRELLDLNAPGYAIGGLSVGEPRSLSLEMAAAPRRCCPATARATSWCRDAGGVAEYVARGVDMMDCVLPSRNARNGSLFTSVGPHGIKQARYRREPAPLDPTVSASPAAPTRAPPSATCSGPAMLFSTLATIHNLKYYLT